MLPNSHFFAARRYMRKGGILSAGVCPSDRPFVTTICKAQYTRSIQTATKAYCVQTAIVRLFSQPGIDPPFQLFDTNANTEL